MEARIEGSREALDAVSNFTFEIGATGLEETADGVRIFFPAGTPEPSIRKPLNDYILSLKTMGYAVEEPVLSVKKNQVHPDRRRG